MLDLVTSWTLLWLWVLWLVRGDTQGQEQVRLGLGQACGGPAAGQCDTNLTCTPTNTSEAEDSPSAGVCSRCIPCSGVQCPRARWVCPGGHVTEPCGCCPQCARQLGQVCGGPHWKRGYCDRGLTCALFLGRSPATPPQTGVCKVLPGWQSDPHADPLCPWVWGCNVRAGACDCYSLQTCHSAFSYRSLEDCLKTMKGDQQYWSDVRQEEGEQACLEWGCEVQGDQCVCRERSCDSSTPLLSEDSCEDQLERDRCSNVSCPKVQVPSCPPDSFLSEPYSPPGQCCPRLPGRCTCAFKTCPPSRPFCPPGYYPHRVTRGNGHPGTCCHQHLCILGEKQPPEQGALEES